MTDTRRLVLETLAEHSSSDGETVTVSALAESLDLSESSVERQVAGLVECDLARTTTAGVRVTLTGEELLELDVEGPVVVDPDSEPREPF
jgi:DNA-binding IclR family transcriptional regulator